MIWLYEVDDLFPCHFSATTFAPLYLFYASQTILNAPNCESAHLWLDGAYAGWIVPYNQSTNSSLTSTCHIIRCSFTVLEEEKKIRENLKPKALDRIVCAYQRNILSFHIDNGWFAEIFLDWPCYYSRPKVHTIKLNSNFVLRLCAPHTTLYTTYSITMRSSIRQRQQGNTVYRIKTKFTKFYISSMQVEPIYSMHIVVTIHIKSILLLLLLLLGIIVQNMYQYSWWLVFIDVRRLFIVVLLSRKHIWNRTNFSNWRKFSIALRVRSHTFNEIGYLRNANEKLTQSSCFTFRFQ